MKALDLFCGVGWDLGARDLGLHPLGVDIDRDVAATRDALGMRTEVTDVSAVDPGTFCETHGLTPLGLLIASPPCTAFSMAGKGLGRDSLGVYIETVRAMGRGEHPNFTALDETCADPTAHLVLEPLRWTLALKPSLLAWEQVRPVIPLWDACADVLRDHGWHVWAGVLSSERYGVPQTRERAILMASRTGPVEPPVPTHQRYVAPRHKDEATEPLFDAPGAGRIVVAEDCGLFPWVSMADALGWGEGAAPAPAPTVTGGGRGGIEVFASAAARRRVHRSTRVPSIEGRRHD